VPTPPRTTAPAHSRAILAIILVSYFMIVLDNSIIFTALPRIEAAMGYSATGLSWVQNAYTLVFGGLLLLGARAGDLLGRRRVFLAGLTVFAVASFLIGVAPTGWWLIAARALQGVGAAVVAHSSLSLLTASFAGEQRTRAVAAYGTVAGIGASVGLVVGGAAADLISWRAGFFLNVPIGAALMAAALRYLPDTARSTGRFDLTGALSATLGMGALVFGIVHAGDTAWSNPTTITALLLGGLLLAVLVANEARAAQPIMPLHLFANRERSGAYLARVLFAGTMIAYFYFTTQFLQSVYGYSPLQAGLAFLPMTLVNFAVALPVPRLTARFGNAALLGAGLAVTLAGMSWLAQLTASTPYLTGVALPMVLIGVGQGLAFAPLTAAGLAQVASRDAGAASGLVNTTHQLGSTLGVAVLVSLSAGAGSALTDRVTTAYTGGSVMLATALVVVLVLIGPSEIANRRATRGGHAQTPVALAPR
jgi:EmrB/QacA subfamily drug resistance transporter